MEPVRFSMSIDGVWSAKDFASTIQSVDTIYTQLGRYHSRDFFHRQHKEHQLNAPVSHNERSSAYRLMIVKAAYSSPGNINFQGLGEVARETRLFLEGLLFHTIKKKKLEAEAALSVAQAESIALENLGKRLDLRDQAFKLTDQRALSDLERKQFMDQILAAQRPLIKAIDQGRITGAGPEIS